MEFTTQLLLIYNKDIVWLKVIQTNKEISLYICNNFLSSFISAWYAICIDKV